MEWIYYSIEFYENNATLTSNITNKAARNRNSLDDFVFFSHGLNLIYILYDGIIWDQLLSVGTCIGLYIELYTNKFQK